MPPEETNNGGFKNNEISFAMFDSRDPHKVGSKSKKPI